MASVTVAGLALAVAPLMISALENWEYTFQPIIIFTRRYQREVERFQQSLRVLKAEFSNECCFLLHGVTRNHGNEMVNDLGNHLWQDPNLEAKMKARLDNSYSACISSLALINALLTDIMSETKTLDILLEKKSGHVSVDWLKRLRKRSKISFSKDRFDGKLNELATRIEGLHRIRKQLERLHSTAQEPQPILVASRAKSRIVRTASCRLHDALSSLWQCEAEDEHFANISLVADVGTPVQETTKVGFNLLWTCPTPIQIQGSYCKPLRLAVEALSQSQNMTSDPQDMLDKSKMLRVALDNSVGSSGPCRLDAMQLSEDASTLIHESPAHVTIPDLYTVPNLCLHLRHQLSSTTAGQCAGFLQKTETFRHLIYTSCDDSAQATQTTTLEEALIATQASEGLSFAERIVLAKILAEGVPFYQSTPWLGGGWKSKDIIFLGGQDLATDKFRSPFLRSRILVQKEARVRLSATKEECTTAPAPRNHAGTPYIRNETLYSLGIILIELAYDSPFADLQIPEDDQGDLPTSYRAATRLGESVRLKFGPRYAEAVKSCLYCAFGASSELADSQTESRYFEDVVQKLRRLANPVDRTIFV